MNRIVHVQFINRYSYLFIYLIYNYNLFYNYLNYNPNNI